jgi:CcmD family protein
MRKYWLINSLSILLVMVAPICLQAQTMIDGKPVEMADGMRASGKIYVVVAVLATILAGLFLYLFSLDRKISKLEKER